MSSLLWSRQEAITPQALPITITALRPSIPILSRIQRIISDAPYHQQLYRKNPNIFILKTIFRTIHSSFSSGVASRSSGLPLCILPGLEATHERKDDNTVLSVTSKKRAGDNELQGPSPTRCPFSRRNEDMVADEGAVSSYFHAWLGCCLFTSLLRGTSGFIIIKEDGDLLGLTSIA
ncbi:uncharacterized protein EI90DRAFT_1187027 [Cantharellus anzutake]|uniref:uncharacterized protein n=1 Tax=Cantharellus anzutake TaxID=1750568 RepID=UPI001908E06E|nr:uncharacterized protein EI90DRAFT_1187027 [Cantharellus anzutake]KAF8330392.1 hypothetical protein EI90DRAFT_1187027 [Cantharellus anzutake]